MAIRLYMTSSNHPENPTISGQASGWLNTPGNVKNHLAPTKSGTATTVSATDSVTTNPNVQMIRRFVSDSFKRAGTFAPGTMTACIARLTSATASNMTTRITLVIHGSNGVARAVVGSWAFTGSTWGTAATAVSLSLGSPTSVAVAIGEFLSVEIGFSAANSVSTSYTGTLRIGGTSADVVNGDSGSVATTRSPWIDLPATDIELLWIEDFNPATGAAALFASDATGLSALTGIPSSVHTMTCWLWLNTKRTYSTWYEIGDGGTSNYYQMSAGASDNNISAAIGGNTQDADTNLAMNINGWYKFVFWHDGPNNQTGVRVQAPGTSTWVTAQGDTDTTPNWTRFSIGWSRAFASEYFTGKIAAVKIWNVKLTEAEQDAEFGYYRAVRKADLLREHLMQGYNLTDYSGNGYTLTAGSTAPTSASGPVIPYEYVAPAVNDNSYFYSDS